MEVRNCVFFVYFVLLLLDIWCDCPGYKLLFVTDFIATVKSYTTEWFTFFFAGDVSTV